MSDDELRPDERWQWGVKHSQGLREESTEASARASLAWLTEGLKRSRPGTSVPQLVRRRVSEWQPVSDDPPPVR